MKVVSNTSPLIFLANVDSLPLLFSCFDHILIPEAVKAEFGSDILPEFVQVQALSQQGKNIVELQCGTLHRGELEAIQLATEIKADLVLLDDLLARKKAKKMGITVMGTLGVFLMASHKRYISPKAAIQKIECLNHHYNMFIAEHLLEKVKTEIKQLL